MASNYIPVGHAQTKNALLTLLSGLEALKHSRDAAVQARNTVLEPDNYDQVEIEFGLPTAVGHGAAFFAELDSVYAAVVAAEAAIRQAAAKFGAV